MQKKIKFTLAILLLVFGFFIATPVYADDNSSINSTNVELYALSEKYQSKISIPSDLPQSFQLKVSNFSGTVEYAVTEGDTVEVSSTGLITPKANILYWNGSIGSSSPTGAPGETRKISYVFGESTITVTAGTKTFSVKVNLISYEKYYAQQVMNEYLDQNISASMTDLEKLEIITKFPAQYEYDENNTSY